MAAEHHFRAHLVWTGALNGPTTDYASYSREYEFRVEGKPTLTGSAAGPFRGDERLHNPEDLLLAAVSACHMLSYFALCARAGIAVMAYEDDATALMTFRDGKMRIVEATLRPQVTLAAGSDLEKAEALHARANAECFIASSVNFPVHHEVRTIYAEGV
ncbi:MAG: OsmC family protein [Fimbriimonas sp.]